MIKVLINFWKYFDKNFKIDLISIEINSVIKIYNKFGLIV